MKMSLLKIVVAGAVALILLLLVVLQSGIFGVALTPTKLLGLNPQIPANSLDYTLCIANGGIKQTTFPRSCLINQTTYFETYNQDKAGDYKSTVESENAKAGVLTVAPLSVSLDRATYPEIQTNRIAYQSQYSIKKNNVLSYARLANSDLKNLTSEQIITWKTLLNAQTISDLGSELGSNSVYVSKLDLSKRGLANATVILDSEGSKLFGTLDLLVVAQIRNNYVMLSKNFVLSTDTIIKECASDLAVISATDKETAANQCYINKIISQPATIKSITDQAEEMGQLFAFE